MALRRVSLDELTIDDEESFAHVALYESLKQILRASGQVFLVPAGRAQASWDRVVFLNLTYWREDDGAEVLCDGHIAADVVAHAAWHHVVSRELAAAAGPGPATALATLFAESIASAFDLYLVGQLLGDAPESDFITTQVPIMGEAAQQAGLPEGGFALLMAEVAREPERAFEDLRSLLLDAATALVACRNAVEAQEALDGFAGHRFEPLLHHYQLSNWVLYARAYARSPPGAALEGDEAIRGLDTALRGAPDAVAWLQEHWIDRRR